MSPPTPETIFADPAASDWLKQSLANALHCDPVDAVNDAEILREVLQVRLDDKLAEARAEAVRSLNHQFNTAIAAQNP